MRFNLFESDKDLALYQKLYEENKQKYYYTALKILHNETDAEDAVQNGFIKFADKYVKYRGQAYDNLVKLVHTIVKNEAWDIARDYERRADFFGESGYDEDNIEDAGPSILDCMVEEFEQKQLTEALLGLSEEERELLYLQYQLKLRPVEIGRAMGMTSNAVRKKILRIRQKLAEILEKEWK